MSVAWWMGAKKDILNVLKSFGRFLCDVTVTAPAPTPLVPVLV
jgi:hypothetical protein